MDLFKSYVSFESSLPITYLRAIHKLRWLDFVDKLTHKIM